MERHQLQLQPRLRLLAELVGRCACLADIGTDHGYLPVWLLQEGRITRAIASDINPEPLAHARSTAEEFGTADRMEFRLCAGLDGFTPGEADTIAIAGMGGETMISILSQAPWTREHGVRILLQPMTKAEELRTWLGDNGYTFTGERLVLDRDYLYPILCVTGGAGRKLTQAEAYGGVALEGDPLWGLYLNRQMKKLRQRIDGLQRSDSAVSREELQRQQEILRALADRRGEGI